MRWTEEETLQLIELYKSYHYLWDNTTETYKKGGIRKQAYESIVKLMAKPNLTAGDVKSKIKNLRSAYHTEMKRTDKGEVVGLRKMPWFQAFKPIMSNIVQKKGHATDSECSEVSSEDSPFIEEALSNSNSYIVSIKQEYLDEMENEDKERATVEDYLEPAGKKARIYEPRGEKLESSQVPDRKLDEFQMFANNLAAQLRRIPLDRALILQVEVQSLIAKERIRMYKKRNNISKDDDDD